MAKDALGAHARDELGISDALSARPVQAAMASAVTFAVGAALPLLIVFLAPVSTLIWSVSVSSLVFLALLGTLAAWVGGVTRPEIGRAGDLLGDAGDGGDGRSRRPFRGYRLRRTSFSLGW